MSLSNVGLSARFIIFLAVVIALIVGLVNYYGYRNTRDHLWGALDSTATSKLDTLSDVSKHYLQTYELELLEALQRQVNAEQDVVYFLIKGQGGERIVGSEEQSYVRHKVFRRYIDIDSQRRGQLILALSTEDIHAELSAARFSSVLTFLITTLVLGGAIYSYFRAEVLSEIELARQEEEILREQHGFMRAVIDHSEGLLVVMDLSGRVIHLNQRCADSLGVSMEEGMNANLTRFCDIHCSEGGFDEFLVQLTTTLGGEIVQLSACQSECRNLQDQLCHIEWHFNVLTSAQGKPRFIIGTGIDVTERRQNEKRLQLARQVVESASEAIIVTDAGGLIEMVNPSFQRISGYSMEEAIGRNPSFMQSGQHDAEFYTDMWSSIREKGSWQGEVWNRRKNGEIFPESITITSLKDEEGNISSYVAIFTDITEQKLTEQYLSHLAHHDLLTELPNRTMLMELLESERSRTKRYLGGFGLLYLDLDNFKPINDQHGHDAGDEVLKIAAKRMVACVRESDTVARIGGDEFCILLPHLSDEQGLSVVAEKIIRSCSEPILWNGHTLTVGISIGGIIERQGTHDGESLLRKADQMMYQSKQKGRNTYSLDVSKIA